MVSMSDELKECNILKLILLVRFACATLDVEHPIYCKSLSLISFETDPELTPIESHAFSYCPSLKSVIFPQNVQFIDGSALSHVSNLLVSITSNNLYLVVESDFILDSSKKQLIRYFDKKSNIMIPRHFQVLYSHSFFHCKSFSSISFETDSELT
jgi:hypothetical protein